jgi:hypothetical protein
MPVQRANGGVKEIVKSSCFVELSRDLECFPSGEGIEVRLSRNISVGWILCLVLRGKAKQK